MKKMTVALLIMICCTLFGACKSEESKSETTAPNTQLTTSEIATAAATQLVTNTTTQVQESTAFQEEETQTQSIEPTEYIEDRTEALQMTIGDTPVSVDWEDNETVQALKELCSNQPLTIQMSMYGGFEQVGSIGTDLPRLVISTST